MEQLGDEIKNTTNIVKFSSLIKDGDVLVAQARQRQNQIYKEKRPDFYNLLDEAEKKLGTIEN